MGLAEILFYGNVGVDGGRRPLLNYGIAKNCLAAKSI